MNIGNDARVLAAATKELALKWDQTKVSWRDTKAAEFERDYLTELFGSVDRAVVVLDQLDKIIKRARNECE